MNTEFHNINGYCIVVNTNEDHSVSVLEIWNEPHNGSAVFGAKSEQHEFKNREEYTEWFNRQYEAHTK